MALRCLLQRCRMVLLLLLLGTVFGNSFVIGTFSSGDDNLAPDLTNEWIERRATDSTVCASLEKQVNAMMSEIEADLERNQKLEQSSPHTELRKRAVLWKPKSKDRKSLLACMRGGRRSSAEEAILDDNEEEYLRCLRAQQRIDSMRDPEARALAQDEECQRQLKRRIDSAGC